MLGKKFEAVMPMVEIINEQLESTRLVMEGSDIKQIFVDGGFSKNGDYMRGLQDGFKGIEVRAANLPHAAALGAAMQIHRHWNSKGIPEGLVKMRRYY
jgi:sugar (pentulose or hexulose) kinase